MLTKLQHHTADLKLIVYMKTHVMRGAARSGRVDLHHRIRVLQTGSDVARSIASIISFILSLIPLTALPRRAAQRAGKVQGDESLRRLGGTSAAAHVSFDCAEQGLDFLLCPCKRHLLLSVH